MMSTPRTYWTKQTRKNTAQTSWNRDDDVANEPFACPLAQGTTARLLFPQRSGIPKIQHFCLGWNHPYYNPSAISGHTQMGKRGQWCMGPGPDLRRHDRMQLAFHLWVLWGLHKRSDSGVTRLSTHPFVIICARPLAEINDEIHQDQRKSCSELFAQVRDRQRQACPH